LFFYLYIDNCNQEYSENSENSEREEREEEKEEITVKIKLKPIEKISTCNQVCEQESNNESSKTRL